MIVHFRFVTYSTVKEAEAAICKYNDFVFGGEFKLKVKLAHHNPSSHEELVWGTTKQKVNQSEDLWDIRNEKVNDKVASETTEREEVRIPHKTEIADNSITNEG